MSIFKTIKDKRSAKKFNITYIEYLDYLFLNEKYNTRIENYISFLKKTTPQQYENYINDYKEIYSIEKYLLYTECLELGITKENSILYLEKHSNDYEPARYMEYLAAKQINLTLDQYDEWVSKYRDSMSASRYLDLVEANKHHISLNEYDEWIMSYKESMTIDRFSDFLKARREKMTLDEYDEWISAKRMNMSVEEYRTFQIASKMDLTLEEYEFYINLKSAAESREKKYIVNSINEIKPLNKLGFENIILSKSIKKIPARAFSDCQSFNQISLPHGVKEIGENAFENCINLKSISFPGTLTDIPPNVLSGCNSLESIYLHHGIEKTDISGWLDLPNLSEVASTASINSFSVKNEKGIKHRITDDHSGSKVNSIRTSVEILEIDRLESVKDFPNLKILIIDSFHQTHTISNCPNLEMIIAGKFENKNDKITSIVMMAPKLKFFMIKDFYNISEKCINLTNSYGDLIWLHVPADTKEITLKSSVKLKIIGVTDYNALPKSVSKGLLYKAGGSEVDPYAYENCKDGRTYISSNKPSNFDLTYERLIISEGTTVVGKKAFQKRKMSEVLLPFSLREIQSEAFANCNNLRKIIFSNVPNEISSLAFIGSDNLRETNIDNKFDFKNKHNIKNLDISDVRTLSLEGRTTIPPYYAYASGIKEIVIPPSVRTINSKAFAGCADLERIVFESDLDEIAIDAFENCENVGEILWRDNRIYKIAGDTGFPRVREIVIPEGVTEIISGTFKNWGLESVTLPSTLTFVGKEAFSGCKNLRIINGGQENTITINNNLDITKTSFKGCTELHEIIFDCDVITEEAVSLIQQCGASTIWIRDDIKMENFSRLLDKSITKIRCIETLNSIYLSGTEKEKFQLPPKLQLLELPKIIQSLSISDLSESKTSLKGLKLSENTMLMDSDFFRKFPNIEEITMHVDTLNRFGEKNLPKKANIRTFGEKSDFTDVYECSGKITKLPPDMTYREKLFISKIVINEEAVEIAADAFRDLAYLKSVEIKGTIKEIKESAFANCLQLEKINLPDGLLKIGVMAFEGCIQLKDIQYPNTIVKIGAGAFRNCKSLEKVTIPLQLTELKKETFMNCSKLTTVREMKNVQKVEESVFKNCTSLKELVFSNTIKSIDNPFEGCTKLDRIVIPNDLDKFIGKLGTCTALKKLYLPKLIEEMSFSTYEHGEWDRKTGTRIVKSSKSPVKIYAYRGSKWKNKVGSVDVIYLNKKEYEDILEAALIESGILTPEVESVDSYYTSHEGNPMKPNGVQSRPIERTQPRASWKTRSIQNTAADPFPENSFDVRALVDSLKPLQSPMYKCTSFASAYNKIHVDEIKVTNGDSIHIPAVITNRIFTVAFDSEIIEDGSAVYVSLATKKGEQISSAIKVELLDKGYKGRIEVQLEILSESNERELFVVIVSMNNNVETILSSRSTKVDIAFAMDMDFGF